MYWGVMGGIEERWRKGPWTAEEDRLLIHHVNLHGEGRWNSVATLAGLKRNGKSCRLRWVNYLRPDLKRGRITPHEETIILDLHARWGNRWSTIARSLPGRTDNEIKNYWRTHFKKKSKVALDESAKLKIRELKRQKFQLEQRQLQLQRLEMQQNITDIKKMMLFLEESEGTVKAYEERQSMILSNGCSSQEISMGEDFDIWRHKGLRNQLVMYWGVMGGIEERWRKGPWTAEEDRLLIHHVNLHGEGRWNSVATLAGLKRNGKSCRLRWVNYLRPDLKRGRITPHEETIILDLHARWGNRWSTIARSLPGRTDNEIKNYWRTHFKKKSKVALDETAKLKIQELKRQKFQQEHRQLQSQQLEMQQKITDIKKMMLFLEESEGSVKANEERQSMILSNGYNYAQEISMGEDFGLWESLWNLDDVHGPNFHAAKAS